ncbi:MAG: hypothetical protein J4F36_05455 [Nitrosopumilaceae archaeon]|nr:hypothetical protein [Nitrosopumilaceae archaeon]
MVWDDLHIEEWFDNIEAVNELDSRKQLTDDAYGELTGIENYPNKVIKMQRLPQVGIIKK